jgi:hypothetical protein
MASGTLWLTRARAVIPGPGEGGFCGLFPPGHGLNFSEGHDGAAAGRPAVHQIGVGRDDEPLSHQAEQRRC